MNYGPLPDMPSGTALLINSFENSVGNISNPTYLKLKGVSPEKLSGFFVNVQLIMIWIFWFLN